MNVVFCYIFLFLKCIALSLVKSVYADDVPPAGIDYSIELDTYSWYQEKPVVSRIASLSRYCAYVQFVVDEPYTFSRVTFRGVPAYEGITDNDAVEVRVLTLAFRRLYSVKRVQGPIYIVYDGSSYLDVSGDVFAGKCSEWLELGRVKDHKKISDYYCKVILFKNPKGDAPVPLKVVGDIGNAECELTLEASVNKAYQYDEVYEQEANETENARHGIRGSNSGKTAYSAAK